MGSLIMQMDHNGCYDYYSLIITFCLKILVVIIEAILPLQIALVPTGFDKSAWVTSNPVAQLIVVSFSCMATFQIPLSHPWYVQRKPRGYFET